MAFDIKGNLKRNKALWIFMGAALVVAILLATFASPFASKSPDGLDKTAHDKGFVNKTKEAKPASGHSPMQDYAVPGIKNEKTSTGLSGLFGVLITVAVAVVVGLLVYGLGRIWKKKDDEGSEIPLSET
ncbi:MAG TPA: PDGLE domain-containing protein [Candidatus Anoxymicrobiaceae bacterium]|jgi:PDGLE domain